MKLLVFVKTATGGGVGKEDAFQRAGRASPAVMSAHDAHARIIAFLEERKLV